MSKAFLANAEQRLKVNRFANNGVNCVILFTILDTIMLYYTIKVYLHKFIVINKT